MLNKFASHHINGMLAYWDSSLICRFANQAYGEWFGRDPKDLIDKMHLQELLGTLYPKNLPYINNALDGKVQVFERKITKPNGETRLTLATYSPDFEEGKVVGFYAHVFDISDKIPEAEIITQSNEKHVTEDEMVNNVIKLLESYVYIGFPGITSLAKQIYVSASSLKRKFKTATQSTLFGYFRKMQMQIVETMLADKKAMKEIADKLNFSKVSDLSISYKKYLESKSSSLHTGSYKISPNSLSKGTLSSKKLTLYKDTNSLDAVILNFQILRITKKLTSVLNSKKPKTIVYAEDDFEDAELFVETVKALDPAIEIEIVENGVKLMKYLGRKVPPPDLIFLDINMPLMNGLDCLREISDNQQYKGLNTIILSTSSNQDQIRFSYDLGAKHFITKATDIRVFRENLKKCIFPA